MVGHCPKWVMDRFLKGHGDSRHEQDGSFRWLNLVLGVFPTLCGHWENNHRPQMGRVKKALVLVVVDFKGASKQAQQSVLGWLFLRALLFSNSEVPLKGYMAVGQNWVPKMGCRGKWNQGLSPAVPWWLIVDPYPYYI